MPYASNQELPAAVREHLPQHAQDIFRKAFNAAVHEYDQRDAEERERLAFKVAWSAVKRSYYKQGERWVPKH